jgi:hypothetical protein
MERKNQIKGRLGPSSFDLISDSLRKSPCRVHIYHDNNDVHEPPNTDSTTDTLTNKEFTVKEIGFIADLLAQKGILSQALLDKINTYVLDSYIPYEMWHPCITVEKSVNLGDKNILYAVDSSTPYTEGHTYRKIKFRGRVLEKGVVFGKNIFQGTVAEFCRLDADCSIDSFKRKHPEKFVRSLWPELYIER